jgi:hypothetical protein
MDHADVMNSCDAKARRVGLDKLTPAERIVTLLSQANFEIECGGMSQYFYNSAGEDATQALAALKEVGAMRAADALQAALALFPADTAISGTDDRFCEALNQVSDELSKLDSEFYAERPDVFSRLCTYVENHASELKEHGA